MLRQTINKKLLKNKLYTALLPTYLVIPLYWPVKKYMKIPIIAVKIVKTLFSKNILVEEFKIKLRIYKQNIILKKSIPISTNLLNARGVV